jgi:hypothetical protein
MYNFRSEQLVNTVGLKGSNQVGLYVNNVLLYYFYQTAIGGVQPTMTERWVVEAIPVEMDVSVQMFTDVKGIDTTDKNAVDWVSIRSALEILSIGAMMHLTQSWHESGLAEKFFKDNQVYRVYAKLTSGVWRGFNNRYSLDEGITARNFDIPTYRGATITYAEILKLYREDLKIEGVDEVVVIQGPSHLGQLHVSTNAVIIKQTTDGSTQTEESGEMGTEVVSE